MQVSTTFRAIESEKINSGLLPHISRVQTRKRTTKVVSGLLLYNPAIQVKVRRPVISAATFESAFDALHMHRVRSSFTMLGVIIGVAALIAIVTLTQGVNQAVNERFADLGANILTISPGTATYQGARGAAGSAMTLSLADAQALAQVPSVLNISPVSSVSEQIVYEHQNWNTRVSGVYPDYQRIQNWQLESGNWFSDQQEQAGAPVAVIGQTVARNLFPAGDAGPVGATIRINNALFRVVGVLEPKGQQGTANADDAIFVPFRALYQRLNARLSIQQIQVEVASTGDIQQAQQDITAILRTRHRLPGPDPDVQQSTNLQPGSFLRDGGSAQSKVAGGESNSDSPSALAGDPPNDFQVLSISQLVDSAQQSATQLTILLIGIAAISLAVGGIGIMNIMLVSVGERTREIGIRIAVGARRRDIRNQFLLEAVILSTSGGIMGILIGLSIGLTLIWGFNLPLVLSPIPTLIAFTTSAAIGIASGLYPAISAARLDPIVAMRQE